MVEPATIIASCLSERGTLFESSNGSSLNSLLQIDGQKHLSDHLLELNAYQQWTQAKCSYKFCLDSGLTYRSLVQIQKLKTYLSNHLMSSMCFDWIGSFPKELKHPLLNNLFSLLVNEEVPSNASVYHRWLLSLSQGNCIGVILESALNFELFLVNQETHFAIIVS